MTEPQWRYHTPERDGHAPDDWVEGMEWDYPEYIDNPKSKAALGAKPYWWAGLQYCYRPAQTECHTPLQDATYEPDLLAQCLALPQDQREALIEAMQKPTLLPCPFCGGEADAQSGAATGWVHCKTAGCDGQQQHYTLQAAIEAWNRRAS